MTELLLYATLGLTTLIILVLVAYLLGIIFALWSAKNSLAQLVGGLAAVRDNARPLREDLPAINGKLAELLEGLTAVNDNLSAIVKVARGS